MSFIQMFLREMEMESVTTRKMLAIVPEEQFGWKPHPKNMSLLELARHVAELPTWVTLTINTSELDFATSPYNPLPMSGSRELTDYFEKCLTEGQESLRNATEGQLNDNWVLRNGETIYSSSSKFDVIRMTLSQIIHHRAQLGVYLRLLNIPIPGSYGPSADTPM